MERLAECDAEGEDEEDKQDADPPADQLLPATSAAALAPLHRAQSRHGT
jgi:hypothetical protein